MKNSDIHHTIYYHDEKRHYHIRSTFMLSIETVSTVPDQEAIEYFKEQNCRALRHKLYADGEIERRLCEFRDIAIMNIRDSFGIDAVNRVFNQLMALIRGDDDD